MEQLLVNYQNTVLEAAREVEDGISAYVGARDRVKFLKDSVNAARRSVELSLVQYREGAVDYQRVVDSQRALLDVEDQYTSARGDVVLAFVATFKALGGGWEVRAGNAFVAPQRQQQMQERTDWGRLLDSEQASDKLPEPPPTGRQQPLFNAPDW